MFITNKTNKKRKPEERETLARNLIIFAAVYEEVKDILSKECRGYKEPKYPEMDKRDYLLTILDTDRTNFSKLCHKNELGSVTKKMVSQVVGDECKEARNILSDKEIWFSYDNCKIEQFKWNIDDVDTKNIIKEIRKLIKERIGEIYKIYKEQDNTVDFDEYEKVVIWVVKKIIFYYERDEGSESMIENVISYMDRIDLKKLECCSVEKLQEAKSKIEKMGKKIDAVLIYREYRKK